MSINLFSQKTKGKFSILNESIKIRKFPDFFSMNYRNRNAEWCTWVIIFSELRQSLRLIAPNMISMGWRDDMAEAKLRTKSKFSLLSKAPSLYEFLGYTSMWWIYQTLLRNSLSCKNRVNLRSSEYIIISCSVSKSIMEGSSMFHISMKSEMFEIFEIVEK